MIYRVLDRLVFLLLASLFSAALSHAQPFYIEDFSTSTYEDTLYTAADWNTTDQELKLHTFAPVQIGAIDTPGWAYELDVQGDHAYVADATSGLQIIDISDPTNPVIVGNYNTSGLTQDVQVVGPFAYCADATHMRIVYIGDPTAPTLIASLDTPGQGFGIDVKGRLAYLADGNAGFQIIDISDLYFPAIVGTYATVGQAVNVDVANNLAFVVAGSSGLLILDVSNPALPVQVGNYGLLSGARDVQVIGKHAFVADANSGLVILDVSDETTPSLVASLATPGIAASVRVDGNFAYVADNAGGLQVVDISDPGAPVLLPGPTTSTSARGIAIAGNHIYLADNAAGLKVFRVAEKARPTPAAYIPTLNFTRSVDIVGDMAYVVDQALGLLMIDISDPIAPVQVGVYPTYDTSSTARVIGNRAYLCDGGLGLKVIDVSDPTSPVLLGTFGTLGYVLDVFVAGHLAYLAMGDDGLVVVDITNPGAIVIVGAYDTPDYVFSVQVQGDYAYLADGYTGLVVLNVNDLTSITLAASVAPSNVASDVELAGNQAYVVDGTAGVQVIDISDPYTPVLIGNLDTPGAARSIDIAGDLVYIADNTSGLRVADISNPAAPILGEPFYTPGLAYEARVSGDYAYVVDWEGNGFQVVRVNQREVVQGDFYAQSLPFNNPASSLVKVRLNSTQVGDVSWSLATTGSPAVMIGIQPDNTWRSLPGTGLPEMVWRAELIWAHYSNPVVYDLRLDYLNEYPWIEGIIDIPNDQGRQVRLEWSRSGYDFADESPQIVEYAVYRRIDPAAKLAPPVDLSGFSPALQADAAAKAEAAWDFLMTVPVRLEDRYAVVIPTLGDSTISEGQFYSTFMVSALTATPGQFFDSPPDSGYSIDDLAPSLPVNITASYGSDAVLLDWDDPTEPDFQYFRVYRGTDPGFVPSPGNLVQEVITSDWIDPSTSPWGFHYKITAIDFAGNESEAGSPGSLSGVNEGDIPIRTTLLGAAPNPFNPSTKLSFVMGSPGRARLSIYDTAGRQVRVILDEHRETGLNEVFWRGKDDSGRHVAAGVYFYRLKAGDFEETKSMVLVK